MAYRLMKQAGDKLVAKHGSSYHFAFQAMPWYGGTNGAGQSRVVNTDPESFTGLRQAIRNQLLRAI